MTKYIITIIDKTRGECFVRTYTDRDEAMQMWHYVEYDSDRYMVAGYQEVTV